ncbi:MAG: S10 family peptidase, partial [Acidobacteriota bacterium]
NGVKHLSRRPLAFIYNGGPGSSSIWLHMGAFGPRRVVTSDGEATPPPPYKLVDNASSLLDRADLVFVDPVGTGFSRSLGDHKDAEFWGIDQDVRSLAEFITTYISRNGRWNSPRYLIGESYGTTRSAALVHHLQSHDGMDFNGVVLISMILDFRTAVFVPGNDLPYALYLPSYAATAYYHGVLEDHPADLDDFLKEVRQFALGEYTEALEKGDRLDPAIRASIARRMSRYTGLSQDYLAKANLRVKLSQFMKELQRDRKLITGRLDARFTGPSGNLLGENADYDPMMPAIRGAFTATFNSYLRGELKFGGDRRYKTSSDGAGGKWDWKRQNRGRGGGFNIPSLPTVAPDLARAMTANRHLKIQVENGLFDQATPFFAAEYTMDHLGLPEELQRNIQMKYYRSGHMMYLHEASLIRLKNNVAAFMDETSGN